MNETNLRRRPWSPYGAIGCGVVVLTALLLRLPGITSSLGWDEVDYVRAAELGFGTNYTGGGMLDFRAFVQKGLVKWLHAGDALIQLPPGYDQANDPLVLAHYHPPLVMYLVGGARTLFGPSEAVARLPSLVAGVATVWILYAGLARLLGRTGRVAGWWAALALAVMPVHIEASRVLSMHAMAAFWAIASVFALLEFRQNRKPRWLYAAAAGAALTFVALDFVPTLVALGLVGAVGSGLLAGDKGGMRISWHAVGAVACFCACIVLLWPGGVLRAGWAQIGLLRAYNIAALIGGTQGWIAYFATTWPTWAFLYALAAALLVWRSRHDLAAIGVAAAFLIFAAVELAGITRIPFRLLIHGTAFYAAMAAVIGLAAAVGGTRAWWNRATQLSLVAACLASTAPSIAMTMRTVDERAAVVRFLAGLDATTPVLADGAHIYRYYLPGRPITDFALFENPANLREPDTFTVETSDRLKAYTDLRDRLGRGEFRYFVLQPARELWDPQLRRILENDCDRVADVAEVTLVCRMGGSE